MQKFSHQKVYIAITVKYLKQEPLVKKWHSSAFYETTANAISSPQLTAVCQQTAAARTTTQSWH